MKLILTVFPDGKAILAVPSQIDYELMERIRQSWDEWKATADGLLIFAGEVQFAKSVEIDLPVEEPGASVTNDVILYGPDSRPLPPSRAYWGGESFTFNGVTYPLGMPQQTLYGNKEQIDGSFASLAYSGYMSNAVVFSCMLVRQSLFSQVRFMFQELRNGIPGDLFSTPDLGRLNEDPSPGETTGDLLARTIVNADLAGNDFIVSRDGELVNLRPDWVTIVLGSKSNPKDAVTAWDARKLAIIYQPGGSAGNDDPEVFLFADPVNNIAGEVCHFAPIKDPLARYRGMPWLTPVIRDIQGDIAASDFKTLFYTNGATPNLVISLDASIKQEAFEKFVEVMEAKHAGALNAFRTMYLGAGATVTKVGSTFGASDGDYKNVQGAGETRIVAAAGLHPAIVTISEGLSGGSLNPDTLPAAARLVVDKTFRYLWGQFAGSMQAIITPPPSSRLWYDASGVDLLKDNEKDRAEVLSVNGATVNAFIREGWDQDSALDAVMSGDLRRLKGKHSGLISVQLHDPNEEPPQIAAPETPKQIPANVPGRAAVEPAEIRCSGCSKLLAEYATAPYRMTCRHCKAVTSVGLGPELVDAPRPDRSEEVIGLLTAIAARPEPAPPEPRTVRTEIVDPLRGTFVITEVTE